MTWQKKKREGTSSVYLLLLLSIMRKKRKKARQAHPREKKNVGKETKGVENQHSGHINTVLAGKGERRWQFSLSEQENAVKGIGRGQEKRNTLSLTGEKNKTGHTPAHRRAKEREKSPGSSRLCHAFSPLQEGGGRKKKEARPAPMLWRKGAPKDQTGR